jgi:hypothetical protein
MPDAATTTLPGSTPSACAAPAEAWTVEALLAPTARRVAALVMLASPFFPVQGLGFDLCMLHSATGLPCPGCGMSRGIAALSQGDFVAALGLNPFSLLAWPSFLALSLLLCLPELTRERVEARLRGSTLAARAYKLVFVAFMGFGLLRLAVFLLLRERFP